MDLCGVGSDASAAEYIAELRVLESWDWTVGSDANESRRYSLVTKVSLGLSPAIPRSGLCHAYEMRALGHRASHCRRFSISR